MKTRLVRQCIVVGTKASIEGEYKGTPCDGHAQVTKDEMNGDLEGKSLWGDQEHRFDCYITMP